MANLENYEGSVKRSEDGNEYVYNPVNGKYVLVVDATQRVKEMTQKTPSNGEEVKAFYRKRIGMLRNSPNLNEEQKARRIADIEKLPLMRENPQESYEYGVGFGVFYKDGELGFTRSAKLYHNIICPEKAGGDNEKFLYLTATNRTAKGVEAFVLYSAQEAARLCVYDWAKPEEKRWQEQVEMEYAQLQPYLGTLDGQPYISVINSTELLQGTTWRNSVLLFNNTTNNYDEIYQFDYTLNSNEDQHDAYEGSWGPILETFQANYGLELNAMGCFSTYIILDNIINTLDDSNTTLRNDNVGIDLLSLKPNHSFLVH